ncbi:MAG: MgtC/SapB family protein [Candidatus Acidiferrales bacterium]
MLHDLTLVLAGRLVLAALLGGVVGLERELRHKPAGLRTNILICFGAAIFTIISYLMAGDVGGDHTRIAAQIIPGIGFIGAGVVMRERAGVTGITSAATIFVIASIGMAVGAGFAAIAIFATCLLLVALILLGQLEDRLGLHTRLMVFHLTVPDGRPVVDRAHQIVTQLGITPHRWQVRPADDGATVVEFDADTTTPQERDLLARFTALKIHTDLRPFH